jgi:hypothetical protein
VDVFVAKYTAQGQAVWAKRFGTTTDEKVGAAAVDPEGNVWVIGSFYGTVDFGGGALTSRGDTDVFLVKLSGVDGTHLWSGKMGGSSTDEGNGVAVDARNGDVVITGMFLNTGIFGSIYLSNTGGYDSFVARYTKAGVCLWAKNFNCATSDRARGVAVDGNGDVVVTGGEYSSVIDFGGGAIGVSGRDWDVYVVKLAGATGGHIWSKVYGSNGADMGYGVGVDRNNDVFVTGLYQDKGSGISFGGSLLIGAYWYDNMYVVKLSGANGGHVWSKSVVSTASSAGYNLVVDGNGDVAVVGNMQGSCDFGGGAVVSAGGVDAFATKYAGATGAHQWSKRYGGSGGDGGYAVGSDNQGHVITTGYFTGTADFEGTAVTSSGSWDAFLFKRKP